jgi:hypothetical protein
MQVSEKDIDNVIVRNLLENRCFRDWFIIKFTKWPVFPYELIVAKRSVRDSKLGETDIFFQIRVRNSQWGDKVKFAWEEKYFTSYKYHPSLEWSNVVTFLIENKITATDQPNQCDRYDERGRQGIDLKKWGYFRCGMVTPRAYLDYTTLVPLNETEEYWVRGARDYKCVVFYEDILEKLKLFRGQENDIKLMNTAIRKANFYLFGTEEYR